MNSPCERAQALLEAAFPAEAGTAQAELDAEKAREVEANAPPAEGAPMPGWGDWGGLGAKVSRKRQAQAKSAAEERAAMLAAAAAKRKDAALSHVIISEKRDKKGAKFTTAGVPYPFKSREQFERSLRNPLGTEWNTADSHAALTQPKVKATRGAVAAPISKRHKGAPAPLKIK